MIGVPLSPGGQGALSARASADVVVTLDVGPSWMALPQAERKNWIPVEVGKVRVVG